MTEEELGDGLVRLLGSSVFSYARTQADVGATRWSTESEDKAAPQARCAQFVDPMAAARQAPMRSLPRVSDETDRTDQRSTGTRCDVAWQRCRHRCDRWQSG
jgi:hypothetical protein